MVELKGRIEELKERFEDVKKIIRVEDLKKELEKMDETMSSQDFWEDQEKAKRVIQRRKWIEETVKGIEDIERSLRDVEELSSAPEEDTETWAIISDEMEELERKLRDLELKTYLSGEMDSKNAYLTIQAGAGGTEACDWAEMLFRMYRRWAERRGYEVEVVDITPDDVAGIKSVTMLIKGPYAYGYLKGEQGVHRLVRISPFDSNARRHTSFAAVSVMPQIDEDINVEIKDEDLKIETFQGFGSGWSVRKQDRHGGQDYPHPNGYSRLLSAGEVPVPKQEEGFRASEG